ncbi:ralA-binding protein 1-like [Corticium candelabrum]|uniref:ralA-binding protein 1-like n=1 Tax=Corticium candelabrum TaxID=121492 RepID=UPI002E264DB6|nr:ralA-binding protein 1-like [Corticium candelabrum]
MLNHVTFKKCHSNITTSHSEINAIDCILGQTVDFEQTDINTITGALKLYLHELPESILTPELAPEFENAGREKNAAQLGELFSQLPSCNKLMLTWLLLHMKHITENPYWINARRKK